MLIGFQIFCVELQVTPLAWSGLFTSVDTLMSTGLEHALAHDRGQLAIANSKADEAAAELAQLEAALACSPREMDGGPPERPR